MTVQQVKDGITRRRALLIAPAAFAGLMWVSSKGPTEAAAFDPQEELSIVEFDSRGKRKGAAKVKRIVKTVSEWKSQLSAEQFYVTRRQGTDAPFTGTYYESHQSGLFRCICCGTAVFSSREKFDSGTGWPSFWAPIAEENIRTVKDMTMFMERVEVRCKRCEAHLGHVFDDGPAPTNLRYCINEASLKLIENGLG